ncbi:MAG: DUF4139 domain-containing protein [Thiobacillaceae bacterium]
MNIAQRLISVVVLAAAFSPSSQANGSSSDGEVSAPSNSQVVAVTIYNDNFALVKERRTVMLGEHVHHLAWQGVSAQIQPETVQLRDLTNPAGLRLQEQNFEFDPLTPQLLLEKYVGKEVTVIMTNPATGVDKRELATVLAASGGVVLKFSDRIETGVPGRLAFSALPDNLSDQPTLAFTLDCLRAGEHKLELAYLTGGLSWKADYVAALNDKDDRLDLNGWVTLINHSGVSYPNANLQLVAGDINRIRDAMIAPRVMPMMARAGAADVQDVVQQNLFEYHLYTLNRPTMIAENETKQVMLMSAHGVPARKEFLLEGANYYYSGQYADLGQKIKIGVVVEFNNSGNGLEMPLPKGIVRVYKQDAEGNAQFVGEDRIDHTAKQETVHLKVGEAFDITADKKQTDFKKVSGVSRYNYVFESAYQITIRNAKDEPVTIKVLEPVPGDWQVLSESLPHTKANSGAASWQVPVAAQGAAVLTYRVLVRY